MRTEPTVVAFTVPELGVGLFVGRSGRGAWLTSGRRSGSRGRRRWLFGLFGGGRRGGGSGEEGGQNHGRQARSLTTIVLFFLAWTVCTWYNSAVLLTLYCVLPLYCGNRLQCV